jgi:protein MAK11
MSLLQSVTHSARIHEILFCKGPKDQDILLVAAEDKRVTIYALPMQAIAHEDEDDIAIADATTLPIIGYLSGHLNR